MVQGVRDTEVQPNLPMGLGGIGVQLHNAGLNLLLHKAQVSAEIVLESGRHKIHDCGCGN